MDEDSPCIACRGEFEVNEPAVRYYDAGVPGFRAALYRYTGRSAQAVRRLKYSRSTGLAASMATMLRAGADEMGLEYDLVVPVPIHFTRRCSRGFNQSELLCEAFPTERVDGGCLKRIRATRPQVGLTPAERLTNLNGAFSADSRVSGKSIMLVDDVLTSGQTAHECATTLLAAGAKEVGVLAFAGEI